MALLSTRRWDPFADLPLVRGMFPRMDWGFTAMEGMKLDVYEKKNVFMVKADLPGIQMKDIKVTVQDHVLTIRADRNEDKEIKEDNYYLREMSYGTMVRSVRLPPNLDTNKIDAAHKDGCLTITIPKLDGKELKDLMDIKVHEA